MLNSTQKYILNNMNAKAKSQGLGDLLNEKVGVLKATYDFAKQGGAQGDISLYDPKTGKAAVLPNKAVIKRVFVDFYTQPTSGGLATCALKVVGAADLLAATAIASCTGLVDGKPDGAASKMIKLAADKTPALTVGTADLTAGKFNVFIEYLLSD